MNYDYTEEHYAEMYSNLPEGLKNLILTGRLALQVSAIGSRHGLNAEQIADLEPAVEDVCLGLILKSQLAENIKAQVGTDDRVSNRIAAEVEIEILRPYEPELVIARQQKEDLDKKIADQKDTKTTQQKITPVAPTVVKKEFEPLDVSGHTNVSAVKNFYNNANISETTSSTETTPISSEKEKEKAPTKFDWDNLGKISQKKEAPPQPEPMVSTPPPKPLSVDEKIDKLTDAINKLVQDRFGSEKKEEEMSSQMKELMRRLEESEKINRENKKIIEKLQEAQQLNQLKTSVGPNGNFSFADGNKIPVDKPRAVEIDKSQTPKKTEEEIKGNVKVTSTVQHAIPINFQEQASKEPKGQDTNTNNNQDTSKANGTDATLFSSVVTPDTANVIAETRNKKENETLSITSGKKVLSLDELIQQGDAKMQQAQKNTAQVVFPTISADKKIDIKNTNQSDSLKRILLEDLEFLRKRENNKNAEGENPENPPAPQAPSPSTIPQTTASNTNSNTSTNTDTGVGTVTAAKPGFTTENFKNELMPKTKEERMLALQEKIKAMNKSISVGGANSINASSLDPYKL